MVLIYISTLERLESENPRTSLFYLFNVSLYVLLNHNPFLRYHTDCSTFTLLNSY